MIDEFQDNNQPQKDLLYLLAERKDLLGDEVPGPHELEADQSFSTRKYSSIRFFAGRSRPWGWKPEGAREPCTVYRSALGIHAFADTCTSMYIARPPISLKKITLEDYHGKVLFHTSYNEYFRESKALRRTRFHRTSHDAHPAQGDTPYPTLRLILITKA